MYINWPVFIILLPAACFGLFCLAGGFLALVLFIYAWFRHERKTRRQYRDAKNSLVEYAETLARGKEQRN
jgi:hypothetical protein